MKISVVILIGDSIRPVLTLFHEKTFSKSVFPSGLTLNGPSSVKNPLSELQPGPPFNQRMSGSFCGSRCDSTNL